MFSQMNDFINYKYYIVIELTSPQEIDINKMTASKECNIYYIAFFLGKGFKFKPDVAINFKMH